MKKIFGKCNISLDQFIEDEDKTYPNNVENFKRHCFKLFKDNQMVFGLMDLSISLVKRSITYLNQEISEKLEKNLIKEREIVQKDHNLFETFGKRKENQTLNKKHVDTSDLFYPKKTNKIQKYADIQVQTNDLPPNNNNIKNEISPRKTLPKAMNLINPSLKYMIEGNFCPPPMFLIKVYLQYSYNKKYFV